jgi:hypothetical protein
MACLLPFCFKIEFRRLRCRVVIRAGAPVNPPAPLDFEDDIKAKYQDFMFDCLGDGCACTLGAPGAWQAFAIPKQGVPYTLNGVAYTIDYSLRFEVRLTWGTCAPPKKAAGGGKKKPAKKRRR